MLRSAVGSNTVSSETADDLRCVLMVSSVITFRATANFDLQIRIRIRINEVRFKKINTPVSVMLSYTPVLLSSELLHSEKQPARFRRLVEAESGLGAGR